MKMNKVKLGDIIQFNPPESIKKGSIAKKIPMEKLLPYTKKISSFENAVYSAGPKFKNNDTLLAKITPCLENGKTAFVDILDENEIAFGSSEFIVLRAINNISDANYIYYLARSPKFRNRAIGCMEGTSGRKRVNDKSLQNETFEIPNIQTQTAVARVLSSFDEKIELNNKINKELENIAKTIYEYWFVQKIDKRWEKGKLSDIANITMGQSPDGSSYNEQGEGIIFYQGSTDFGVRFPEIRQYTTKPTRFAEAGDILLSVRAPVGTINFANKKCCIGRGLAALNSKIGSITHLYFILKDLEMVFNRRNTDGTTFGAITKDDLFSLSVKIPPKNILIQYEKIAKPIFEKQFEIAEESSTLAQLRDFLLPLLMNGQVKVKNG